MTEKYEIENIGNMFRVLKDGEPLTTKFENWDRMDVINLVEELNKLNDENKELKAKVDDKEVAVEVECEKLMQKVFDLIDEKIKYYRKQPILAVRISANCEHRKSCLHNHEVNVCNKAKENAYRELKKELQE